MKGREAKGDGWIVGWLVGCSCCVVLCLVFVFAELELGEHKSWVRGVSGSGFCHSSIQLDSGDHYLFSARLCERLDPSGL